MSLLRITSNPFKDLAQQWQGLDPGSAYRNAVEGLAETFLDELHERAEQTGSTDWIEVMPAAEVWREPSGVFVGFVAGTDQDERAFELEYGSLSKPPISVFRSARNSFDFKGHFEDRLNDELFGGL